MLSLSLIALDATVLATAVPTIVGELGDFALFPWLFSGYLLAQAVTTPLYAKLSDVYGRKPVILVGIGLFLLGSILCAVAWSMPALIIARAVQGIGAGAVQPMSVTIVADIYSLAERAKVQGYVASVWAVASVIGPTLGGLFAEMGIWRGIFVLNVPLCLLAAWMMVRRFHENTERGPRSVDYPSAVLLTLGLTLLVLAILGGGQTWEWDSPASFAAFGAGGVLLAAFVFAARRAAEPILPGFVLTRRLLLTTTLAGLAVGGHPDRAHLVRAHVSGGLARGVTGGGGPCADHPDYRLATDRGPGGQHLPADRFQENRRDRGDPGPGGHRHAAGRGPPPKCCRCRGAVLRHRLRARPARAAQPDRRAVECGLG